MSIGALSFFVARSFCSSPLSSSSSPLSSSSSRRFFFLLFLILRPYLSIPGTHPNLSELVNASLNRSSDRMACVSDSPNPSVLSLSTLVEWSVPDDSPCLLLSLSSLLVVFPSWSDELDLCRLLPPPPLRN